MEAPFGRLPARMKTREEWLQQNLSEWEISMLAPSCPVGRRMGAVPIRHEMPTSSAIHAVADHLVTLLLPLCSTGGDASMPSECDVSQSRHCVASITLALQDVIFRALVYECENQSCPGSKESCKNDCEMRARAMVEAFFASAGDIRDMLREDVLAGYEGDPAARSEMEVVLAYPGFYAIAVHRIAHCLLRAGVPLVPRVMSEHAHSRTGIDIHPGATIGPGFFIDHGTGVVIGETCVIGTRVKLYQGVTLGALSFAKDENGQLVKGIKRHPDVGDRVIVYAGATILGGDTKIGHDSVIGGNVWLTHSVPPFSKVYNVQPDPIVKAVSKSSQIG